MINFFSNLIGKSIKKDIKYYFDELLRDENILDAVGKGYTLGGYYYMYITLSEKNKLFLVAIENDSLSDKELSKLIVSLWPLINQLKKSGNPILSGLILFQQTLKALMYKELDDKMVNYWNSLINYSEEARDFLEVFANEMETRSNHNALRATKEAIDNLGKIPKRYKR